jgi:hypothetical protein
MCSTLFGQYKVVDKDISSRGSLQFITEKPLDSGRRQVKVQLYLVIGTIGGL